MQFLPTDNRMLGVYTITIDKMYYTKQKGDLSI